MAAKVINLFQLFKAGINDNKSPYPFNDGVSRIFYYLVNNTSLNFGKGQSSSSISISSLST